MAQTVIADAGPLIALALVDELGLLSALFGSVWVTESVRDECLAKKGPDQQRIADALLAEWLQCQPILPAKEVLPSSLGPGEADSIRSYASYSMPVP